LTPIQIYGRSGPLNRLFLRSRLILLAADIPRMTPSIALRAAAFCSSRDMLIPIGSPRHSADLMRQHLAQERHECAGFALACSRDIADRQPSSSAPRIIAFRSAIDLVRPALAGAAARFPTDRHFIAPSLG